LIIGSTRHRQQVVEVVRHAPGKLSERLQPLGPRERALGCCAGIDLPRQQGEAGAEQQGNHGQGGRREERRPAPIREHFILAERHRDEELRLGEETVGAQCLWPTGDEGTAHHGRPRVPPPRGEDGIAASVLSQRVGTRRLAEEDEARGMKDPERPVAPDVDRLEEFARGLGQKRGDHGSLEATVGTHQAPAERQHQSMFAAARAKGCVDDEHVAARSLEAADHESIVS